MYSVPGRSVQRFLQARLQVWHPMHLSRWKTMETWARIFMRTPLPLRLAFELMHNYVGVAIRARRTVVVEAIAVVRVSTGHQHGLETHAGQAVGPSGTPVFANGRFRKRDGSLRSMVKDAEAARNAGADHGPGDDHAIVVVGFHPVVVEDVDLGAVLVVEPERLHSAGKRQHAQVIVIRRVDVPLAVRGDAGQGDGFVDRLAPHKIEAVFERDARLEGRARLPECAVGFVILVKLLASGERTPGYQPLHVLDKAAVGAALVHDARPAGAGQNTARLSGQIAEAVMDPAVPLSQVRQRQSHAPLPVQESPIGYFPV